MRTNESSKKLRFFHRDFSMAKREEIIMKKDLEKITENNKKISLYELEKNFVQLQRNTIESYLQGEKVDQEVVNKDFMAYILDNFERKAKENYHLRKKFEILHEKEHENNGKRFSFLNNNRPNTANFERISSMKKRPQSSNFLLESQRIKSKVPNIHDLYRIKSKGTIHDLSKNFMIKSKIKPKGAIHYISVREQKKQKKIEENKRKIEKVQGDILEDLEDLGELERKAIAKLKSKFVLYNNTNYEIIEENNLTFLNRKKDLKAKNFLIFDGKFRSEQQSQTKIVIGKKHLVTRSQLMNNSIRKGSEPVDNKNKWEEIKENEIKSAKLFEKEQEIKSKSKFAQQEKHLQQLKQFKKKFESHALNEEELIFFDKIRSYAYNSIKYDLMAKPYLINITDKVIIYVFLKFY